MPRVLAIDWNDRVFRYVVAETRRGDCQVVEAQVVPLLADEELDAGLTPRLCQTAQSCLSHLKTPRMTVLLGVPSSDVQSLDLTIPPAADDELPGFVVNAAMQQSSAINEDSRLDYLASPHVPGEPRRVAAVVLPPETHTQMQAVCQAISAKPQSILIRPQCLTSVVDSMGDGMLIWLSCGVDSADLCLMHDGQLAMTRSLRLPLQSDDTARAAHLSREIRRSLLTLPDTRLKLTDLDRLVLFGRTSHSQEFAAHLERQLETLVTIVDPLEGIEVPADAVSPLAPLVGMVRSASLGRTPAIDFLNPRKPRPRVNLRQRIMLATAAVFLLAGSGGFLLWSQLAEADQDIARLTTRRNELNALVKRVKSKQKLHQALTAWNQSRISWLDELRDLALRLPPENDLSIQQMSMLVNGNRGATIRFRGRARHPDVVTWLEQGLRDQHHRLLTPGLEQRRQPGNHPWGFQTTIQLKSRAPEQYISHLGGTEADPLDAARTAGQPTSSPAAKAN